MLVAFLVVLALPAISDWYEPAPEFVFARLACSNRDSWMYWPQYWPDMPPWKHDFPASDEFFVGILHELTGVRVRRSEEHTSELQSRVDLVCRLLPDVEIK